MTNSNTERPRAVSRAEWIVARKALRPSKRPASVFLPSGVSKTYSFATLTQLVEANRAWKIY